MKEQDAADVVFRFVEHIKRRELAPPVGLMKAEHRFVDPVGDVEVV